jgi:hypothetical protein
VFTGLIAAFVYAGATASLRRAELVQRLPAGTAGELARTPLGVPASEPLAEVVRRAHEAGSGAVLVVGEAGVVAVVSEAAVAAVPEHRRPWVAVGDVARRVDGDVLLARDLGGEALLAALRRDPAAEHLVQPEVPGLPDVLVVADVARRAEPARRRRLPSTGRRAGTR